MAPKEFIYDRDFGRSRTDAVTGEPVEVDAAAVKVGWTKELESVQLAVVRAVPVPDGYAAFNEHGDEVQYVQLDRGGINRLIGALRSARDDAFGADA